MGWSEKSHAQTDQKNRSRVARKRRDHTVDEELKVKTSEYAAAKAQLSGISRKTGGSLATRDLGDIVQESDVSFFCCSTS
jgi:hypothetical protein